MKQKISARMLAPAYVTRFRCLEGKCPDTCCFGWDVFVDADTHAAYRHVDSPVVRLRLAEALIPVEGDAKGRPAKICSRDSGQHCHLLTAEGRCLIHEQLGADALPNACYSYPRVSLNFGGRLEQTLSLSCPAAADMALGDPDAFDFVNADLCALQADVGEVAEIAGLDIGVMDEVRMLAIQLFKTEGLDNSERLLALGILCNRIDALLAEGRPDQVPVALAEVTDFIESGEVKEVAAAVPRQPRLVAPIFSMLIGDLGGQGSSQYQREIIASAVAGLGLDVAAADNAHAVGENYVQGLELIAPAGDVMEDVLRRFLLNEVVRVCFPWGQGGPIMRQYRYLLLLLGSLRLMLVGVASDRGCAPDRPLMSRVTQVFCRVCMHSPVFAKRAELLMSGANFDTLRHLFALLK